MVRGVNKQPSSPLLLCRPQVLVELRQVLDSFGLDGRHQVYAGVNREHRVGSDQSRRQLKTPRSACLDRSRLGIEPLQLLDRVALGRGQDVRVDVERHHEVGVS